MFSAAFLFPWIVMHWDALPNAFSWYFLPLLFLFSLISGILRQLFSFLFTSRKYLNWVIFWINKLGRKTHTAFKGLYAMKGLYTHISSVFRLEISFLLSPPSFLSSLSCKITLNKPNQNKTLVKIVNFIQQSDILICI